MSFIFNGNETPEQAAKRRQSNMDMLQRGAMQPAQNVGEGMGALAQALAWRKMNGDQKAAQADPWNGLRQPDAGGPFGGISSRVMALFGR